jgi:hypothetical protein
MDVKPIRVTVERLPDHLLGGMTKPQAGHA